jgi:hypothetical protein
VAVTVTAAVNTARRIMIEECILKREEDSGVMSECSYCRAKVKSDYEEKLKENVIASACSIG